MGSLTEKKRTKQAFALAGMCLFVAVLCLPLVQTACSIFPDLASNENRVLAPRPVFQGVRALFPFARGYEAFFNDNFGFKNVLVRINGLVHVKVFGVSPTPLPDVVVGRSGWLFYNVQNEGSNFRDYYGLDALSGSQLESIRKNIESMRARMASLGIHMVFLIAPSKQSVYEEYLPPRVASMKGRLHRVDQIAEVWGENDRAASFLDLRPVLISAKKEWSHPLYLKTDSHWNNLGAFIAYGEIMKNVKRFHPHVRILTSKDFRVCEKRSLSKGDLTGIMGTGGIMEDTEITFEPLRPAKAVVTKMPSNQYRFAFTSRAQGVENLRVLMFGDSFAQSMIPFLAESFSEGFYFASPPMVDFAAIEKEKPHVVVVELTERYAGSLKMRWSGDQARPKRWVFPPPERER